MEGLNARQRALSCSYVPQRSGIAIELSALDVVLMGFHPRLRLLEQPDHTMHEQALRALERVGLRGKEDACFLNLSEGEKQLCILARTLVSGGRLLLLDEPESALDFRRRYEMLEMLHDWAAETGGSVLAVLHDPDLALRSCDRLLLLHRGGEITALDPKSDARQTLEAALSRIYGLVTLSERRPREYAMWKEG